MKLLPVALALFHRKVSLDALEVWVQTRTDTGPFQGLLEFPGGGIEAGESPLQAAVREVEEEVGISVDPNLARFMGIYTNEGPGRTVLLYVHLFPAVAQLQGKGEWLRVKAPELSAPLNGKIPPPNHQMIDDLYRSLYDGAHP